MRKIQQGVIDILMHNSHFHSMANTFWVKTAGLLNISYTTSMCLCGKYVSACLHALFLQAAPSPLGLRLGPLVHTHTGLRTLVLVTGS